MARKPGLSVRLKLTLSYAGFLVLAGAMLLALWVIVLRFFPHNTFVDATRSGIGGALVPGRSLSQRTARRPQRHPDGQRTAPRRHPVGTAQLFPPDPRTPVRSPGGRPSCPRPVLSLHRHGGPFRQGHQRDGPGCRRPAGFYRAAAKSGPPRAVTFGA